MDTSGRHEIASFIGNGPLALAVERSIQSALDCAFVHLAEGKTVWEVFCRSLDAVVRDIESHPQGVLFRRLIEFGSEDRALAKADNLNGDGPLTRSECETCVEFIKSHMVNRFKGDLAELLALQPCIELARRLVHESRLSSATQLYFGETIQERAFRNNSVDPSVATWGSFTKGADGLLVEHFPGSEPGLAPSLKIGGVVEVKSMASYPKRILAQISKHLARLTGGLRLGGVDWPPDGIQQPIDGPHLCRVMVKPSKWKLSRKWERTKLENGGDQLVTERIQPPQKTQTDEWRPGTWKITLEWSHEALEEAAYEMTFWYMSRAGKHVYERRGLPSTWQYMTMDEAGFNAVKEMLYHLTLSRLSSRQDDIAIRLYNVYSFGYALGVDGKTMLWPEDFP